MKPLRINQVVEDHPTNALSAGEFGFLNYLRFTAMQCRAKPRTDLFEACALLHGSQSASQEAHAEALMRCLNGALRRSARLCAPGTAEITFDESWLVQLGRATAQHDEASLRFLLASRVAHENRRLIRFLVARVSECFNLN